MSYDKPIKIRSKEENERRGIGKKYIPLPDWKQMIDTYFKYRGIPDKTKDWGKQEFEKNLDGIMHDKELHNFLLNYYQVLLFYTNGGKYWNMMKLNDDEYDLIKDLPYETLINGDQKIPDLKY